MKTIIKTDSTGDAIYNGVMSKIASTAVKDSKRDTDTSRKKAEVTNNSV